MSLVSALEALGTEIDRCLGLVDGSAPFRNAIATIHEGPLRQEDIASRGFPAVGYQVVEAKRTAAVTGRIRMSVSVRFSLFANASRSVDANDGVLSLAADVETALMREWKNGTSADNLSTACAADFILWQFDKLGRVKHSPQKRSTAHAFDLWMTAVLHRPFDQP